jgi:hypothetical protein
MSEVFFRQPGLGNCEALIEPLIEGFEAIIQRFQNQLQPVDMFFEFPQFIFRPAGSRIKDEFKTLQLSQCEIDFPMQSVDS